MRAETEGWWRQAEADLRAGEWNQRGAFHFMATWCAQQAAEKALKALWLERNGRVPPRTHDLWALGEELTVPDEVARDLEVLIPAFDLARYPDDVDVPPVDAVTEELASRHLSAARRIVEWVAVKL